MYRIDTLASYYPIFLDPTSKPSVNQEVTKDSKSSNLLCDERSRNIGTITAFQEVTGVYQ
jgi:hypothetical protein